ncbi:DNA phosphorothioation system sulfurtransferase DndC [Planktothrix agardhii]|uniref:DNA phosphorothioation system sulfurtransferase DndC n=1 Tax=Planktothrix agardhii TaxID=1160 RepID=UPI001D0AB7B0|nr:DNA phosphorothioation system sulfurtransferase DndC [Planktothrix agardhii]MCB8785680.1 DNA phosphorothioation system sulfurtransferase DndC [Planktothrix agardhii 1025]MCB8786957.1 DNA phosphorothioation system sulfurtransferase DndC [Planktothrix agardhii 1025]MCF3611126.1 DNA phosphorothioation system sulfurtransferase DndC [Planktothrix agardhii 1027]MCF3611404.1 DNA phosphorothioation system sulfurtransferase DndC [Planktothrix agardhii 1027]MCF3645156.1 DNA phosphorothioation system 
MTETLIGIESKNTVEQFIDAVEILTQEIQDLYLQEECPLIIGWSGGKDSTSVLQIIWNSIAALPVEQRTKTIHVITNDTLVENPIISTWVKRSLEKMQLAAKEQKMPIETHLTYPAIQDTFWVCLIGKGYPTPRQRFRWCTDRLKIQPADSFIQEVLKTNREAILVLGTRKTESIQRSMNMAKHRKRRVRDRLNTNPRRPDCLVYSPIEDWRTDEVWMYLMQWENPWGLDNKELLAMYRGATADNDCPLVVDTSTPSCGSSRFGCWVCTLVTKDKSMEAMIINDEAKEWMQPLLNLRNELDPTNDRDKRDFRRIFGKVQLFERNIDGEISVEPIPGPYTKKWREHWLRRVLEAQQQIRQTAPEEYRNITLITIGELSEIRRIWLEEKHEFDDSVPKIYQEVMGETFEDPRLGAGNTVLGADEWELLEELSQGDTMYMELMAKLIDTERQYKTMARRNGIYDDLEKCLETSSRPQEQAINNAHYERNLKEAAKTGNVEQVKHAIEDKNPEPPQQLSWGSLKFQNPT